MIIAAMNGVKGLLELLKCRRFGKLGLSSSSNGEWRRRMSTIMQQQQQQKQCVRQNSTRKPKMSSDILEVLFSAADRKKIKLMVAPLLERSTLLIKRETSFSKTYFLFMQECRYHIVDVSCPEIPVGLIREQSNVFARKLLRKRRPFVAHVTDDLGNELFRIRRPFSWRDSSVYAEINGKGVGVVHQRWHLWKRIYDVNLGNQQFAVVENPGFVNCTFTFKDINGKRLAQIDHKEKDLSFKGLLTFDTFDTSYVIRFGASGKESKRAPSRPLTLSERAVTVALVVSIDNDYYLRGGWWDVVFTTLLTYYLVSWFLSALLKRR